MPAASSIPKVHRSVRLLPGTPAVAHQLAGTAGACRFIWNHFVALKQRQYFEYRCWQDYKIGLAKPRPNMTFFGMGTEFTALRRQTDWLRDYSFQEVRYSLKYLADAYREFFKGQRGYPRFKSRYRNQDGFTIPSEVKVEQGRLHVPKTGKLQLKGGSNLYAGCKALPKPASARKVRPLAPSGTPTSRTRYRCRQSSRAPVWAL